MHCGDIVPYQEIDRLGFSEEIAHSRCAATACAGSKGLDECLKCDHGWGVRRLQPELGFPPGCLPSPSTGRYSRGRPCSAAYCARTTGRCAAKQGAFDVENNAIGHGIERATGSHLLL